MSNIEELRIKNRDKYLGADVICTYCGGAYRKSLSDVCPLCGVRIFDRDKQGEKYIIDPAADKSGKYRIILKNGEIQGEYFPGELVVVPFPALSDTTVRAYADDSELSQSDGAYRLLMPAHDVKLVIEVTGNMANVNHTGGMDTGNMCGGMSMMSLTADKTKITGLKNDGKEQ